jgi:hypothetical protein
MIEFSKEHLNKIDSLQLGIYVTNAKHAIDGLMERHNLSFNEAFEQYIKNETNRYNIWLSRVESVSTAYGIPLEKFKEILSSEFSQDVNDLKSWHNSYAYINKFAHGK